MKNKYKNLLEDLRNTDTYWIEMFTQELIGSIVRLMKIQGVSQKVLAGKINLSEAYVSKVLNGNANLSISSIVKFSKALDSIPHIHLASKNKIVEWNERSVSVKELTVDFVELTAGAKIFTAGVAGVGKLTVAGVRFEKSGILAVGTHRDPIYSAWGIEEAVAVMQEDCRVSH